MKALILVDIQRDFLPGGNLPVENGDRIVPVVNSILPYYPLIAITQDWHLPGHLSFASSHRGREPLEEIELNGLQQTLWPDHCIQGSSGAEFPGELNLNPAAAIFRKGTDPEVDSYSGFFDNGRRHKTGLADWLRGMEVDEAHIAGLAAEICVAYTARDAIELGFRTAVVEDGTRALSSEDFKSVLEELKSKGVRFIPSVDIRSATTSAASQTHR